MRVFLDARALGVPRIHHVLVAALVPSARGALVLLPRESAHVPQEASAGRAGRSGLHVRVAVRHARGGVPRHLQHGVENGGHRADIRCIYYSQEAQVVEHVPRHAQCVALGYGVHFARHLHTAAFLAI